MWRDLRNAGRALSQAPGFSLAAILALALAIGANGAIFGLVDALWFRPAGVRDAATLVRVFATTTSEPDAPWSWPEYLDLEARVPAFEGVAARGRRGAIMLAPDGSQELLLVNVVSTNFFQMLGVRAHAGRVFLPGDEARLAASPGVVLGHAFWRTYFGGDPGIVGRTLRLGRGESSTVTILGVLPLEFRELEAANDRDLWMPPETWSRLAGTDTEFKDRNSRWFELIARRRPGISTGTADAEVRAVASSFAADHPEAGRGRGSRVVDDLDHRLERGGVAAQALLGLVLLIVLITCVNVANLLLARAAARTTELAVRVALGASRWRIVRQLGCESLLLGLFGAVGGLIVAGWLIRLLPTFVAAAPGMRSAVAFQTDGRVVLFTAAVTIVTTVLFGLAPAWFAARADVAAIIKSSSGASRRRGGLSRALVASQVAISLVMLCVAADLARSFAAMQRADLGFTREPLVTLWTTFGNDEPATLDEAAARLGALPGVTAVALAVRAPLSLSGSGLARPVAVPGDTHDTAGAPEVKFNAVSANYFEVFGTRIVRGRAFSRQEERGGEPTVVITEAFVRRYFGAREPIGSVLQVAGVPHRIVGIAQDGVIDDIGEDPQPYMYLPIGHGSYGETTFAVETAGDPAATAAAARIALRGVDARLEPRRMITMAQYVDHASSLGRMTAALAAMLGGLGLILTAIGVYGVVAYRAAGRTREIGIRIALGAARRQVMRIVMRDGLALGLAGIALGLPLALAATHLVASMLVGVNAWDALSFGIAAAVLLAAIALATAIPAARATRIEPSTALRSEPGL